MFQACTLFVGEHPVENATRNHKITTSTAEKAKTCLYSRWRPFFSEVVSVLELDGLRGACLQGLTGANEMGSSPPPMCALALLKWLQPHERDGGTG